MSDLVKFQGQTVERRTLTKFAAGVRLLLDAQPWAQDDKVDPLLVDVPAKEWRSIVVGAKRVLDEGALPGIAVGILDVASAGPAGAAQETSLDLLFLEVVERASQPEEFERVRRESGGAIGDDERTMRLVAQNTHRAGVVFDERHLWLVACGAEVIVEAHRRQRLALKSGATDTLRFTHVDADGVEVVVAPFASLDEPEALAYEDEGAYFEPPREQRIGRNDPCPCGSGRKYKKCCLAHSEG